MWIFERLKEYADREALSGPTGRITYKNLLDRVAQYREGLRREQIGPGNSVALVGDFSPDTAALFLSVLAERGISVPLTSRTFEKHPEFLETARVSLVADARSPEVSFRRRRVPSSPHPLIGSLKERGESGLVLFTSGSTGPAKAVLHSLDRILEKFQKRRPSLRTIPFLLLDHIGGVNTFFHVLLNGGTLIPVTDRTPDAVCSVIQDYRVELLPVSPTFINLLLLSGAHERYDLSSLKKITYGTEPMPEPTLERLADAFPNVVLQQTYGLSELGILRSKSRSNRSLWVKVGGEGFETKVHNGTLHIRARSSMVGYLNAPSPFDADGWFDTGDRVEKDGEFIRFLGRKSEIINVGGEKVFPTEVEGLLLQIPGITEAVVFGEPNPITGQVVVARINVSTGETRSALKKRIRSILRKRTAAYKIPQKIIIVPSEQYNERFKKIRRPDLCPT